MKRYCPPVPIRHWSFAYFNHVVKVVADPLVDPRQWDRDSPVDRHLELQTLPSLVLRT